MREIEVTAPTGAVPTSAAIDEWTVSAIAPGWTPVAGESELRPVRGRLTLHPEGFVFRADDAVDRTSGEPVVASVPAEAVLEAGPLSPGSKLTPTMLAGLWMPRPLRRFRCGGFAVRTRDGAWVFDSPHGVRRARELNRRYTRAAT
jgi:hypothetical protein